MTSRHFWALFGLSARAVGVEVAFYGGNFIGYYNTIGPWIYSGSRQFHMCVDTPLLA